MYRDWTEDKKKQKEQSEERKKTADSSQEKNDGKVVVAKFSKRGEAALISAAAKTEREIKDIWKDLEIIAKELQMFREPTDEWVGALRAAIDEGKKQMQAEIKSTAKAAAEESAKSTKAAFAKASDEFADKYRDKLDMLLSVKKVAIGVVIFFVATVLFVGVAYVKLSQKKAVYEEGIEDARKWRQFSEENPKTTANWLQEHRN